MKVERIKKEEYSRVVSAKIKDLINSIKEKQGRVLITFSGGSTPKEVYDALSKEEIDWSDVYIFLGDERFVDEDDSRSNFKMIKESFLDHIKSAPKLVRVDTKLPNAKSAAEDYEKRLKENALVNSKEAPCIDINILGVGDDGHTASLFPNSPILESISPDGRDRLFVDVMHPSDNTKRVTMTPSLIVNAKNTLFLIRGKKKSQIAKDILDDGSYPIVTYPSMIYKMIKGDVVFYLDDEV